MTVATTAIELFDRVKADAESIKNDERHVIAVMDIGDSWCQGDIRIERLASVPKGAVKIDKPSAQLAPGTTQGARHVIADMNLRRTGMTFHAMKDATPLDGPVIDAPTAFEVTHPEHGDVCLPPGVYGVMYQRALADGLRRVQD